MEAIIKEKTYFVAILPSGKEVTIYEPELNELIDGLKVQGDVLEEDVQDVYDNGEFARTYSVYRYFKIFK